MIHGKRVIHRETLPSGDDGVARTVAYMTELAETGQWAPEVTSLLPDAMRPGGYLYGSEWAHEYVRELLEGITFRHDPPGLEAVTVPERMALDLMRGEAAGDCDCIATLGAALARAAGLEVSFVTVAASRAGPWSHVFAVTEYGDLDVSRELQGVTAPRMHRATTWGRIA